MDSEKYNRSVNLLCPTCGNSQLEIQGNDQENKIIRCPSCDRIMTKEELIRENGVIIDANVDEMKEEILKDVKKEFNDMLKNTFKNSKNIRIK